jgi:hypothetical protein
VQCDLLKVLHPERSAALKAGRDGRFQRFEATVAAFCKVAEITLKKQEAVYSETLATICHVTVRHPALWGLHVLEMLGETSAVPIEVSVGPDILGIASPYTLTASFPISSSSPLSVTVHIVATDSIGK